MREMAIPDDIMKAAAACLTPEQWNPDTVRAIAEAMLAQQQKIFDLLKNPAAVRINYLRGDIACQALIDEAVEAQRKRDAKIAADHYSSEIEFAILSPSKQEKA